MSINPVFNVITRGLINGLKARSQAQPKAGLYKPSHITAPGAVMMGGMFSWLTGDPDDQNQNKKPQEEIPSKLQLSTSPDAIIAAQKPSTPSQTTPTTRAPTLPPQLSQQRTEAINLVKTPPISTPTRQRINQFADDFNDTDDENTPSPIHSLPTTQRQAKSPNFSNDVVISDPSKLVFPLPPIQQRAKDALYPPTKAEKNLKKEFDSRKQSLKEFHEKRKPHRRVALDKDDLRHYYELRREVDTLEDQLPESRVYLPSDSDFTLSNSFKTDPNKPKAASIEYPYGHNDSSSYTPEELKHRQEQALAKRSQRNPFEYDQYQRARHESHYEQIDKLRRERRELIQKRQRDGDNRSLEEIAQGIGEIDEFDIEGYPGGNTWDPSFSGLDLPNEERIDWLNPDQIDLDRAIKLVETQFDLPISILMKTVPMREIEQLIVKHVAQWQWYWIEDEQEQHRVELIQNIDHARRNGEFEVIFDLPKGNLPPPIDFPTTPENAFITKLSPEQEDLLNCSMHILTQSYFGNENSQLESQQFSLDMIDYFERRRAGILSNHENGYLKRRDDEMKKFQDLQSERNELLGGKRNFDARVIQNMEELIANKLNWRREREELGLEIEYDPEIDQSMDDLAQSQFDQIKETSKLLKKIQDAEDELLAKKLPDIVSDDLMQEIDNKLNNLLETINQNASDEYKATQTLLNDESKKPNKNRIITPGKKVDQLSMEELVKYNAANEKFQRRKKHFQNNLVEFLEDERAFRFQLDNNQRRQDFISDRIENADDCFIDLIDSYYTAEKEAIRGDLQKNCFNVFDLTGQLEQYHFLVKANILNPLPENDDEIGTSLSKEVEQGLLIVDSIFKQDSDEMFFFDEVRNIMKRLSKNEHSVLKLRPQATDPAISQYRALRRSAYYKTHGNARYPSLDSLLKRFEDNDPSLTKEEFELVKDFILNPHKHDGSDFNYFSIDLQDDPLRYKEMTDYGLSAGEAFASLYDQGVERFKDEGYSPRSRGDYLAGGITTPNGDRLTVPTPTGDISHMYSQDNLQKMLIIDKYEQNQKKTKRRQQYQNRMKRMNPHLATQMDPNGNFDGYYFDLVQPYDPFYLTLGMFVPERGVEGHPNLDQLIKYHNSDKSKLLPYFYNTEIDAMYSLPLNHFETLYQSHGRRGEFLSAPNHPDNNNDIGVTDGSGIFPVYFGLDVMVPEAIVQSQSLAQIPLLLPELDYVDVISMKESLQYLSKL
jgi:hypothetical protein